MKQRNFLYEKPCLLIMRSQAIMMCGDGSNPDTSKGDEELCEAGGIAGYLPPISGCIPGTHAATSQLEAACDQGTFASNAGGKPACSPSGTTAHPTFSCAIGYNAKP